MKRLLFYFPSCGPGGIQSIILRMADASAQTGHQITIIDSHDGYISKNLNRSLSGSECINLIISNRIDNLHISSDHIFVCFNHQLVIAKKFHQVYNINFIYWDVHSNTLAELLSIKAFSQTLIKISPKRLFLRLQLESRLITIDKVSEHYLHYLSGNSSPISVLGIPISLGKKPRSTLNAFSNIVRIVYIGRSVDWKVIPFLYCAKKIKEVYRFNRLIWDVYTDSAIEFQRISDTLEFSGDFDLNYHENYTIDEIWKNEFERVSICIGMGTAQFESALLNIPTLLVPAITDKNLLEEYDPIWVHTLPDYVLGYDESTKYAFESIDGSSFLRLSHGPLKCNAETFKSIDFFACHAREIYAHSSILLKLLNIAKNTSNVDSSYIFKIPEVFIGISWQYFILSVKSLFRLLRLR